MRYRAISGRYERTTSLIMECSGCGRNLREYLSDIDRHRLNFCPCCGKALKWLCGRVSDDKIIELLNKAYVEEGEAK